MVSDDSFDWTATATSNLAELHPTDIEIADIDLCMSAVRSGDCEVFQVPLYVEGKDLFLVRSGRFSIVFFYSSEKAHVADVQLWGNWLK